MQVDGEIRDYFGAYEIFSNIFLIVKFYGEIFDKIAIFAGFREE